jgi:hypothetical protein
MPVGERVLRQLAGFVPEKRVRHMPGSRRLASVRRAPVTLSCSQAAQVRAADGHRVEAHAWQGGGVSSASHDGSSVPTTVETIGCPVAKVSADIGKGTCTDPGTQTRAISLRMRSTMGSSQRSGVSGIFRARLGTASRCL